MAAPWYLWTVQAAAVLVAFVAAFVVWRTAGGRSPNRRLALVFLLEGTALTIGASSYFLPTSTWPRAAQTIQTIYYILPLAYLRFLATLPTRIVAWLRPRAVQIGLLAIALVYVALYVVRPTVYVSSVSSDADGMWIWHNDETPPPFFALYLLQVIVPIFGLIVALASFSGANRGTAARARAGAYAAGFGVRDVIFIGVLGGGVFAGDGSPIAKVLYTVGLPLASLIPIAILTYGILRTQLFDIDLKLHWSIQKGTVIGIIVAGFFISEKLAEQFLSREFGWVIGSVLAGLLVFLAPRLNKLGDKVASTALPQVEPTSAYVAAKKIEVYKAAVESAHETGGIDARERLKLDKLRSKLGLAEMDARAVEVEVLPA